MAITSLNRFTVPLSGGETQGTLMPKLKYRYRIFFEGFGATGSNSELTKQVQTAARPNVSFAAQTIEVYNSKINYAGKHTWAPIAVTLRDDVTGEVSRRVGEQLQKQFDFLEQSSAASASDYKFTMSIEMLDGGNGTAVRRLERWECYGCYLVSANYQTLSYSEAAPQTIDLSIQPDNCVLVPAGEGNPIFAVAGRALRTLATG